MLLFVRNPTIKLAKRDVLVSEKIKRMITKMKLVLKKGWSFRNIFCMPARFVHRLCRPWIWSVFKCV